MTVTIFGVQRSCEEVQARLDFWKNEIIRIQKAISAGEQNPIGAFIIPNSRVALFTQKLDECLNPVITEPPLEQTFFDDENGIIPTETQQQQKKPFSLKELALIAGAIFILS